VHVRVIWPEGEAKVWREPTVTLAHFDDPERVS
jgi:hypothetical protein